MFSILSSTTHTVQKRHRMIEKQNDLKEVIVHLRTPTGAPAGPRDLSGQHSPQITPSTSLPPKSHHPHHSPPQITPSTSLPPPNHTIPITPPPKSHHPHHSPTHSPHCAGKAVSSGQIPSSLPVAIEVPRMADGEKGCESCLAIVATRWYQWGPAHEHCRLCNFCYTYWRKYGGLKLPTRWGEFSRPLCAPLVTPLSPDHTPQRLAKRGLG